MYYGALDRSIDRSIDREGTDVRRALESHTVKTRRPETTFGNAPSSPNLSRYLCGNAPCSLRVLKRESE